MDVYMSDGLASRGTLVHPYVEADYSRIARHYTSFELQSNLARIEQFRLRQREKVLFMPHWNDEVVPFGNGIRIADCCHGT